jgi:transcriptional regulator with XRE-family HTH domain
MIVCFNGYMDSAGAGDDPELPTTAMWRRWMRDRREALGMTQGELGRRCNISQPIISDLETGRLGASSAVRAISAALGIPPPYAEVKHGDELRLLIAGRTLREHNEEIFAAQLLMIETLAKGFTPKG